MTFEFDIDLLPIFADYFLDLLLSLFLKVYTGDATDVGELTSFSLKSGSWNSPWIPSIILLSYVSLFPYKTSP